jgi:antitoxin VapB
VDFEDGINAQSSVFKSNRMQAVRLPKAVALPEHVKRVAVINQGSGRLVVPAGESWRTFFDGPRLDADFLSDRAQPLAQRRRVL